MMTNSRLPVRISLESDLSWKSPAEIDGRTRVVQHLNKLEPEQKAEIVTRSLTNARAALAQAIESSDVNWLVQCKARAAIQVRNGGRLARKTTELSANLAQAWHLHQLYNKGLRSNKLQGFIT